LADSLREDHLHRPGQMIGIPNLGWYAFRHTYRTLHDDLGTPVGCDDLGSWVSNAIKKTSFCATRRGILIMPNFPGGPKFFLACSK
jgi:hypothetical protein